MIGACQRTFLFILSVAHLKIWLFCTLCTPGGRRGDVYNPPVCLLLSHHGVKIVNPTLEGTEKQIIQGPSQVADEGGAVLSVYLSWSRYACWGRGGGRKNEHKFKHDCLDMLWGSKSRPASFRKQRAKVSDPLGAPVSTGAGRSADHRACEAGYTHAG